MAYKDEYEVARLHLDPSFQARVHAKFGANAKIAWELHLPFLRASGLKKKAHLGGWFTPALKFLRAMKCLRGTSFDFFGRSKVRQVERALVEEYCQMVETALARLTDQTYDTVLAIAVLPEEIRGFDRIKLACVERYRERANQLLTVLGQQCNDYSDAYSVMAWSKNDRQPRTPPVP